MTATNEKYLGSKVAIPGGGSGILKYVGDINGKIGTFAGVELIGPSIVRGKNSGDFEDIHYFKCKLPGTGLFLPFAKLKALNLSLFGEPTKHVKKYQRRSSTFIDDAPTPLNVINNNVAHSFGFTKPRPQSSNSNSRLLTLNKLSSSTKKRQSMISTTTQPPANTRRSMSATTNRRTSLVSPGLPKITSSYKSGTVTGLSTNQLAKENEIKLSSLENKVKILNREKMELESEHSNLNSMLSQKQFEMNENLKILNNLQRTVNELQPLLENYELEINDKDLKIARQKNEFERAREEWRQTMDIMMSDNQASEEFYSQNIYDLKKSIAQDELTIKELQEQIINMASSSNSNIDSRESDSSNSISEENKNEFKKILARYDSAKIESDKMILEFKTDIIDLKTSLKSTELELNEKNQMIKTLSSKINQSKNEYEELLNSKNEKLKELTDLNKELNEKVNELEEINRTNDKRIKELESQIVKDSEVNMKISEKESQEFEALINEKKQLVESFQIEKDSIIKSKDELLRSKDEEIASLQGCIIEKNTSSEEDSSEVSNLKISIKLLLEEKERILSQNASLFKDKELELNHLKDELNSLRNNEVEIERLRSELQFMKLNLHSRSDGSLPLSTPSNLGHSNIIDTSNINTEVSEDDTEEVKKLKQEIINLKTTSPEREELLLQLTQLKKELEVRPMLHEVIELEDEIELLEEIRREDIKKTKTEMTLLKEQIRKLEESLKYKSQESEKFSKVLTDNGLSIPIITPDIAVAIAKKSANSKTLRSATSTLSLNKTQIPNGEETAVAPSSGNGELLVYQPPEVKDPSFGRSKWCGLCERDGHDSVDCPYENDMF